MPATEPHRLRFLDEAAALLHSASPSTSAHLLSVQTRMLHADSKSLNPRQQKHHCAACGRIRGSQTPSTNVRPRKPAVTQGLAGATVYNCARCHRRAVLARKNKRVTAKSARVSVPSASASASSAPSTSASPLLTPDLPQDLTPTLTPTPTNPKPTDNASSKKRAKARKQGGLQALLAAKQKTQPSLDLFDFLQ